MALTIIIAAWIIRPQPSLEQIQTEYINQIKLLQEEAKLAHEREIEKLKLQVEIEAINAEKPIDLRKAELESEGRAAVASEIAASLVGFFFVIMVLGIAFRVTYPFKSKSNEKND